MHAGLEEKVAPVGLELPPWLHAGGQDPGHDGEAEDSLANPCGGGSEEEVACSRDSQWDRSAADERCAASTYRCFGAMSP